jgi:UDP-glucose 4-epimerase
MVAAGLHDEAAMQQAVDGTTHVIHSAAMVHCGWRHLAEMRHVNVEGTRCLLEAMRRHACRTIVFSSTAALYGVPETLPIPESACIQPANPYGQTKAAVERLLADVAQSEPGWRPRISCGWLHRGHRRRQLCLSMLCLYSLGLLAGCQHC